MYYFAFILILFAQGSFKHHSSVQQEFTTTKSESIYPVSTEEQKSFPRNLHIKIDLTDTITHNGIYGFRVRIINNSDSSLYYYSYYDEPVLYLQAKTTDGKWRDIEDHAGSWCGTGFGFAPLKAKSFLVLSRPFGKGDSKTKLRLRLSCNKSGYILQEWFRNFVIYSEEFEGSANPEQFWNSQNTKHPLLRGFGF